MARKLTHLGKSGEARMVDVSAKDETERVATAEGRVLMSRATLDLVLKGDAKKGEATADDEKKKGKSKKDEMKK